MAVDEHLAEQLRTALGRRTGMTEKRMFGGLAWLLHGNMLCGLLREEFIFRVGPAQEEVALARPGTRIMDLTGRRMGGFVMVEADAAIDAGLDGWIALALRFVAGLPPKGVRAERPGALSGGTRSRSRRGSAPP